MENTSRKRAIIKFYLFDSIALKKIIVQLKTETE